MAKQIPIAHSIDCEKKPATWYQSPPNKAHSIRVCDVNETPPVGHLSSLLIPDYLIILFYFTLFLLVAVLAKRNPRIFSRLVWEVTCDIAMLSRGNLSLLFHGLFD